MFDSHKEAFDTFGKCLFDKLKKKTGSDSCGTIFQHNEYKNCMLKSSTENLFDSSDCPLV